MDREARLGILASAILEGTPIDWAAVEASADPADQPLVRQLQTVAEIAALHRRPGGSPSSSGAQTVPIDDTVAARWGHLRLFECVGRGTFGEVYRAWDTHLDREVALKLLRTAPAAGDPSASISDPSRVVHEGRLLARIRHPHVITVYGAESREGRVGIWMEFIRGRTLHQIVEQQGPLGAREAAALAMDLCRALAAVHGAGLLHRDVTARNVMREDGGRVVLMDFGAGHESESLGSDRAGAGVTGTPLYMAPELFAGGRADHRTEIYALGVLLFHLVTGRYPVIGRSVAEIREAHRGGERTRLRDVRADLPAAFVHAVEKAIAPEPAERCQSAGELEAVLEQALLDRSAAAVETRRRSWLLSAAWVAAGVGAVAGLASLAGPWWAASPRTNDNAAQAAAAAVLARRITPPPDVSLLSNPSDDGRYAAGMVNQTGDAAIVDLARGEYRPLRLGRGDFSDGYASLTALSPDGTLVAVDWHNEKGDTLHVVRADGRDHRVLIDSAADVYPYQWTRDGSMILTWISSVDGVNTVALVAAADGAVRPIYTLGRELPELMTLSPDGRYIAYDYPQAARSRDRDLFVIDTHTGGQWPLVVAPGHDSQPLWSPDGKAIVFFSDRNRSLSAWMIPMQNGRPQGEPRMVKDDVGRVWPRGFTRDGALHYQLAAGFAEVYVAELGSTTSPLRPQPISPRQALSNYYPIWSPDGRYIVFTSERRADGPRELWTYDTGTGREEPVPTDEKLGRPFAWSPDGRRVLAHGPNDERLYVVDRASGRTELVDRHVGRPAWLRQGVVYTTQRKTIVLYDPDARRPLRTLNFADPAIEAFALSIDGRSALALTRNDRLILREIEGGAAREWYDAGTATIGHHMMAPHTAAVAYVAQRQGTGSDGPALKVWPGSGDPRVLLQLRGLERMAFAGWTADGYDLLVLRWTESAPGTSASERPTTLWRVPAQGGTPVSTGLVMDALRDLSLHPDGRRIAFNAGFKQIENWVMENLLPR